MYKTRFYWVVACLLLSIKSFSQWVPLLTKEEAHEGHIKEMFIMAPIYYDAAGKMDESHVTEEFDGYGNMIRLKWDGGPWKEPESYQYSYDSCGNKSIVVLIKDMQVEDVNIYTNTYKSGKLVQQIIKDSLIGYYGEPKVDDSSWVYSYKYDSLGCLIQEDQIPSEEVNKRGSSLFQDIFGSGREDTRIIKDEKYGTRILYTYYDSTHIKEKKIIRPFKDAVKKSDSTFIEKTTYEYDSLGLLRKEIIFKHGITGDKTVKTYKYNSDNKVVEETDIKDNKEEVIGYVYDSYGFLKVKERNNNNEEFYYYVQWPRY